MALIPQSFIDELMSRIDIVDVIDARVPLKKAGHEYKACCPFHNEKTPSFTVSQNKQFYHCFGCGAHGTAIGFLMEYEHLAFPEAVEELARNAGMNVPYEGGRSTAQDRQASRDTDDLYALMQQADDYYRQQLRDHPQRQAAVDYLKGRGLSGQIAVEFGIGYAPPGWDNLLKKLGTAAERQKQLVTTGMLIEKDEGKRYDRFRHRIMFPIRDRRGRTIAFGGRVLSDEDSPKYLNSPETPLFHKGRELYGLYEARQALRQIPRLLVVEGYMDVVSLAQFDIRYAVATLGTATTADHLQQLFKVTSEVVFCFDGDRAGRDAAWRAMENALPVMREGHQIRFLFLPEGEDPDTLVRSAGKAEFEQLIRRAAPFSDYLFNSLSTQNDTASIDGRANLVEQARPLLARLPPGVYRQMMISQLAQLARIDESRIETALNQTKSRGKRGTESAPAAPPRRAARGGGQERQTFSPVRRALARLLHDPGLAAEAGDPRRFSQLEMPGIDLLIDLLETLHHHPNLTTSALLERWRESEHIRPLEKLAAWQPEIDDTASLKQEFTAAIEALDRHRLESRYDMLMAKSNHGNLSPEEKVEIRQLSSQLFH
ncbi:DNA primase [Thiohalophilus sp.]|uniref:DNA primase n=1 Tax=Thiohalophilus sp. TaxID=3028392 RepID=UPI002ACD8633|nr:DNA primase [Thiohalophilus sp.]MDZ7661710.1 DNA primase [Thiohalophilus sp.]